MKFRVLPGLIGLALPLSAQYAGPAVLSRGEAPSAMAGPELDFRPFLRTSATYSTALAGVGTDEQGKLATGTAYGAQLGWGIGGVHSWRHTKLGLDYAGSASHFHRRSNYDTLDNTLLLGVTHQLSRRTFFSLNQSAGMVTRDFGLLGLPQTVPFDPAESDIPTTDYFNNRTYHIGSQANLTMQRTARLSFNFGGGGSLTRRRSKVLNGNGVISASGDVQYRLSRRVTVGGGYRYAQYHFTRVTANTNMHAVTGSFAMQLSRWVEFSGYAGIARPEIKFIQVVPIDPVIAALLGVSSGTRVVHSVFYSGQYGARISRTFENGVVYASVGRGLNPGNGLFMTSLATRLMVGYGYTGLRKWSISLRLNQSWAESLANIRGGYNTTSGGFAVSRSLRFGLHATANYSLRRYDSPTFSGYNRLNHQASVGLGWTPGPVPLRVW